MTNTPILLLCGVDWWMEFAAVDPSNGGAPVALTSPRMEIRANVFGGSDTSSPLLFSSETTPPTIVLTQPSPGVVQAAIAGATTKNEVGSVVGFWDAYAVDPNGRTIELGSGPYSSVPNVAAL